MIKQLEIQNINTNETIHLGVDGSFILDKVDWDAPSVSLDSYRVPFQIGTSFLGVTVGTRKPMIIGYVVADMKGIDVLGMNWNDYYEKQEQLIEEQKQKLDKLISINQWIIIKANGYNLKAKPTQPPKYSNNYTENNEVMCYFELQFECFDPMFYSETKYIELATVNKMFYFPLEIPEESGVVFGEIQKRKNVLVENDSDVDCGCIIKVKANGGIVTNPRIYNANLGEYIEFNGLTLEQNDVLTIITEIGQEDAIVHRNETSIDERVISKMIKGSKFIQIKQGTNYYAYEVESGESAIEVVIEYTEKKMNIRGM